MMRKKISLLLLLSFLLALAAGAIVADPHEASSALARAAQNHRQ